eukprot:325447-Chlamydomonas_euryale.AAC.1
MEEARLTRRDKAVPYMEHLNAELPGQGEREKSYKLNRPKLVPTVRNPTRLGVTCMQTERPLTA